MEPAVGLSRTVLNEWHRSAGARMVPFGGFEMPVQYTGILNEHLATRARAGLFDISHMGRFLFSGDPVPFLQYVLTNNANALCDPGMAQYTLIPDESGAAVDDAYLYRIGPTEYMLVVNASNRGKDWDHLSRFFERFPRVEARDASEEIAMLALQGPRSEEIMDDLLARRGSSGRLPENEKNRLSTVRIDGVELVVARTGYTGEPVGLEMFPPASDAVRLWELILEVGASRGVVPVGLGARDTLRLEAGYPLYGHELGEGPDGKPIPIFAVSIARAATRFDEGKGDFVGRAALFAQYQEVAPLLRGASPKPQEARLVPYLVWPLAILNGEGTGPGSNPPRPGNRILREGREVGWVTSGSTVPHWGFAGEGLLSRQTEEQGRRAIGLAYVDAALRPGEELLASLVRRAIENSKGRQLRKVNLIPSEQTPSLLVRLLSILDPAGRYAEHNRLEALGKAADDIFHYQGTDFIKAVEAEVQAFFRSYLGCSQVEARPISGQMANHCVFRGLLDYVNRFRKGEPERVGYVLVNSLRNGGHLSAQMLGALANHVRHDPHTGRPAVITFPVRRDDPYAIDVDATKDLIERYDPRLIVFGKSLVLYREPVREIAEFVRARDTLIMYDMAHVLGLVGPHFQRPFEEGAHIVTGSTHKTFFGTQRGIVAGSVSEESDLWPLWEKITHAAFPGSTSNHHLGTLLGLLGACYEMMAFGDAYQRQLLANARAFARALQESGLTVEGDPSIGYTETHQVVLRVGNGPEVAARLERNNVVVNSQTLPTDPSVTAASGIRLGVQEMTRFGMKEEDFGELAGYVAEVLQGRDLAGEIADFRGRFVEMQYCLSGETARALVRELMEAVAAGY